MNRATRSLIYPTALGSFGAPMGRREINTGDYLMPLYCHRVPMVDGGYDPGGAYWGAAHNRESILWCVWAHGVEDDLGLRLFIRAPSAAAALAQAHGECGLDRHG